MKTLHTDEEILDLVNEQDLVIGTGLRSEIYRDRRNNFRVINAFLVNDNGELWIPRRTAHKKIFPLCLDMSVAGHVASGEEYDDAFRRELQEELNLSLDEVDWKLLGHLTPHEHGVSAFMKVYEIRSSKDPNYNRDDFIEHFWLKPYEILNRLTQGDVSKDDLPRLIKKFYQC